MPSQNNIKILFALGALALVDIPSTPNASLPPQGKVTPASCFATAAAYLLKPELKQFLGSPLPHITETSEFHHATPDVPATIRIHRFQYLPADWRGSNPIAYIETSESLDPQTGKVQSSLLSFYGRVENSGFVANSTQVAGEFDNVVLVADMGDDKFVRMRRLASKADRTLASHLRRRLELAHLGALNTCYLETATP